MGLGTYFRIPRPELIPTDPISIELSSRLSGSWLYPDGAPIGTFAGIGGPMLGAGAYIGDGEGDTDFRRCCGCGDGVLYVRPCPAPGLPPYPGRPRL